MNKKDLREYFLLRKIDFHDTDNLQEQLDNISIFNSDKQIDMKSFFIKLTKILSWELINSVPILVETNTEHAKIKFVLNLQAWSRKAWEYGIENANISKIITAYTIIERLYLCPNRDLNWCIKSDNMINFLRKALPNMTFDVQLDSLSADISFRDRKAHEIYRESLENKNYKKIIMFLSDNGLKISTQNHPFYNFIKIISKLAVMYPALLLENIRNYSPVLLSVIFDNLENDQIVLLLEEYKERDPLPLLLGLIKIVNPEGDNRYNKNIENDNIMLDKITNIIQKITHIIETDNIFNFISDCSNISMNKLWHGIFITFIVKNNNYSQCYIDSINLLHNIIDDLGEYTYSIFNNNNKNKNEFDAFSIKIYEKYLYMLKEIRHGHYIQFTNHYQFIFHAIRVISDNSFSKYLKLLEKKSLELLRAIYSWDHGELCKYFTDWYFWVISAKLFTEREPIEKDKMQNTYKLLNNEKIFYYLNCKIDGQDITFNELINILDSPNEVHSILMPYNDNVIEIKWEKIII